MSTAKFEVEQSERGSCRAMNGAPMPSGQAGPIGHSTANQRVRHQLTRPNSKNLSDLDIY